MDEGNVVRGMVSSEPLAPNAANAAALEREFAWMAEFIEGRVGGKLEPDMLEFSPPPLVKGDSLYASLVCRYEMDVEERVTLLLALAPHVRPDILDAFFRVNESLSRGHSEFGGIQGRMHGGFLPTGETVMFLLAGRDLRRRFECQRLFDRDHFFAQHSILKLDSAPAGEPAFSGQLVLAGDMVDLLTTGELRKPDFSSDFPARLITTAMDWGEIVLASSTLEQIRELEAWVRYESVLMQEWGMGRRLRPGYRCLFHGPPGTGKTLTATVIGKRVGRDVYRIGLASVVSKYIGETEKNLERIFDRAENMNCILFFDEADALFGKRTNISDAHDRYANQEVSFLLQRIEDFSGVVVLASNFMGNIDESFMRRFQAVVHFPMPNAAERRRLWGESLSQLCQVGEGIDLDEIATRYELTGGAIINVLRYASLMALAQHSNIIRNLDLKNGIRRELQKDGRTL